MIASKEYLNRMGLFYSGDRNKNGINYSSKSGESYDIWHNQWWHYSGATGTTFESLDTHIRSNNILNEWLRNHEC